MALPIWLKKTLLIMIPIIFAGLLITSYFFNEIGFGKKDITTKKVNKYFSTKLTPANWGLILYSIMYVWQIAIILFLVASFVIMVAGTKLYEYPYVFSFCFLASYTLALITNMLGLFIFNYSIYTLGLLPFSLVLSFISSALFYVAVIASYRDFKKASDDGFYKDNFLIEWFVRIIIHNGLNIYATWLTIAQFLLLSSTLVYFNKVKMDTACIISLSLLLVVLLVYISMDLIILDNYTRYVITPHLVILWIVSAIISHNYKSGNALSILTGVTLILSFVMFVVKIAVTVVRHRKDEYAGYTELAEARRII